MNTTAAVLTLALLAPVAGLDAQAPPGAAASSPATAPAQADCLAARTLIADAHSLGRVPDAVARAGRILVLLECARDLCPQDVPINRALADLYEGLGQTGKAASAAEVCLRGAPEDFAMASRWLAFSLAGAPTAEERIALLEKVLAREEFPAAFRAEASAELCGLHLRRGDKALAEQACRQALALDRFNPRALRSQGQLAGQESAGDAFGRMLTIFQGNPRNMEAAWEIAQRLQGAGAYDKALAFYEHAWALAQARRPGRAVLETLLVDYVNAALDNADPRQAAEILEPPLKDHGSNLALRALAAETYRALDDQEKLKLQLDAMARTYRAQAAVATQPSASAAAELAWYNLNFAQQPTRAMELAAEAVLADRNDPYVQRVWGAAQLATGANDEAVKTLGPLVPKDPYAAGLLARHYYQEKLDDQGKQALLGYSGPLRTGPGWRVLASVAREHQVALPPAPDVQVLRRAADRLEPRTFDMGRFPERFVSVQLAPVAAAVAPGEPIEVIVELKNLADVPVPVGPGGLFAPVVLLSLTVEGEGSTGVSPVGPEDTGRRPVLPKAAFAQAATALLPAPKYLGPQQKVVQTARLDSGPAALWLGSDPLGGFRLTVTGLLDPLLEGEKYSSSVPGLTIAPAEVARKPLFDAAGGNDAAQYALASLVQDLKEGPLPAQLRAARQTAALLAWVRSVEAGKAKPVLPEVITKPVLLSMTRAFLKAPSPATRAEMLSGLALAPLDERTLGLLDPADASPLVRLRLIELLAAKRARGIDALLEAYQKDADARVRQMAAAVAKAR